MSIPRFAIERPVMMAMISAIVILLGGISLTPSAGRPAARHLAADDQRPRQLHGRRSARDRGAAHAAARAAAERGRGPRADELDLAGGQREHPAELRVGHRPQRGDGRHPHAHRSRARPPAGRRRSADHLRSSTRTPRRSWARVESIDGTLDRVALRELAENVLSPRLERVPGVAAVTVNGGLRRQIHVELSRRRSPALDLSVDRVVNVLRTENQNIPIGEIYQRRPALSAPQPGPVRRTSIRSAISSC